MNLNRVILIGRIAGDINYTKTNSGVSLSRTRVAINRNTSSENAFTDFIPIVAWRNTADFMKNYVTKGTLVAVEGTLVTSVYEAEGRNNFSMEVRVNNLHLLEPRWVREKREEGSFSTSSNYGSSFNSWKGNKNNIDAGKNYEKFTGKSDNNETDFSATLTNINFDLDDD